MVRSIGEGGSPDPLYEIADDYHAYWFTVLREDADLIEGGQGSAVQRRAVGRWQTHVARIFEAEARAHAQRLVSAGGLPADTVVGRWWRDETAEIDVLGLSKAGPVLVGEARWQPGQVVARDLAELRRKSAQLPSIAGLRYACWTRGGATDAVVAHPDVVAYPPTEMLA